MDLKTIILWVLIIAFIIPGYLFGFKKLLGGEEPVQKFKEWHYPLWFMHVLGLVEITGCTLLLFNQTRLYGLAVFPVVLAGAVYTHAKNDDPKSVVMRPIFVGLLLVAIFFITH